MKQYNFKEFKTLKISLVFLGVFCMLAMNGFTQGDSTASNEVATPKVKARPVRNTFESVYVLDDQSVMVPIKGTFEADIQHRFGTVENGVKDLYGLYSSANMRIGFHYSPINNLYLGFGLTKNNMLLDGSAKYAIIKQTPNLYPVSVTYYGDLGYKTVADPSGLLFKFQTQRLSFFNEVLVARKFSEKFSAQVGIGISHQNSVPGYYAQKDTTTYVYKEQKFDLFSSSVCVRYKITDVTALILEYDQPLTRFATNNPHPNVAFGFEFNTSGHTFQLFAGNYSQLNPQQDVLYNTNNPFGFRQTGGNWVKGGQFLIGFNITRLWNF